MIKIQNTCKILFAIILCNFAISNSLFSQKTYDRKISISEWVQEMESSVGKYYYMENVEIYFDENKDSLYSFLQPLEKPTDDQIKKQKEIHSLVILFNCKLPDNQTCHLRNLNFTNNLTISNSEGGAQLYIYNCTFSKGIDFHHSSLNMIHFMYCKILQRTVINEMQMSMLSFSRCDFYTDYKVVEGTYSFGFEKENRERQYLFNIRQNEKKITTLYFEHCELLPTEVKPIISFTGGKYDVLGFDSIKFTNAIIDFKNCFIKENFIVEQCDFSQAFGTHTFNFPSDNTMFNWRQLNSHGLAIYNDDYEEFSHDKDTVIFDLNLFNQLTSSYRKFYTMYRTQGDTESANACFIQMKDMETRRFKYLYNQELSLHKWFNWRFNQFLKYFSDYGTNPVQSLIISIWVILFFAGVYFFFYSNWDGINRTFLINKHKKLIDYFTSEQKLEDFYTDEHKTDLKNFANYKKQIEESRQGVPVFISLLGKPLYFLSVIKHRIKTFIYHRTDILHGRWVDLKPARKVYVNTIVAFSLFVYSTYLVLIRALNSITLSINAFTTLGFGAIPVSGISRYLTIIEGFLGWFLLSIFSVSLIGQMLQN